MQPKNWATSVAVATLHLQQTGDGWRVADKSSSLIQSAGHAEDAAVAGVAREAHAAATQYVSTAVGTTMFAGAPTPAA